MVSQRLWFWPRKRQGPWSRHSQIWLLVVDLNEHIIAERMDIMPRGDGTGPTGQGQGRGRMGGPFAAGPGGHCVCPNCGYEEGHRVGQPCNKKSCPKCGATLMRG